MRILTFVLFIFGLTITSYGDSIFNCNSLDLNKTSSNVIQFLYDGKDINSWQFYALEVNSKKSENYDNLKSILKSDLKSPIFVGHDAYKMSEDMLIIIAWHTKISALEYSKIKMLPKNNRRGSDASFKPLKSPNLCFLR